MDVNWIYNAMAGISIGFDIIAVLIITVGLIQGLFTFLYNFFRNRPQNTAYKVQAMKSLRVGLDYLVAGDIISSVAIKPTIDDVVVLTMLILIRTFLSWTITLEVEGRWPWQPPLKSTEI